MEKIKIGIIGGGASGMVAAVEAARNGAEVVILERMDRVGKKLLATGNGRCNYTNIYITPDRYHSTDLSIASNIIDSFTTYDAQEFFRGIGIEPYTDETGKVFPTSLQASSVVDVLRDEYTRLDVVEKCSENVLKIEKYSKGYRVTSDKEVYLFNKIIIAAGGKVGAKFGSDGSGLRILEKKGYKSNETYPALVKVKSDFPYLKSLKGYKTNCNLSLFSNGECLESDFGEVLFADYGISGPPVLQLSGRGVKEILSGREVYFELDFFPELNKLQMYELLENRFLSLRHKSIKDSFTGLIHKRFVIPLLKESNIVDFDQKCTKINKKKIYEIIKNLKSLRINVLDYHSWNEAQVTGGGISLNSINPETMESKREKGLYISGEILDLYGDCGGFNLHWAWATGIRAGIHASSASLLENSTNR
jgi:predicted Rossmann fold flavoprotein